MIIIPFGLSLNGSLHKKSKKRHTILLGPTLFLRSCASSRTTVSQVMMRPSFRSLPLLHPRRLLSTSRPYAASPFTSPAPPRLPKEDQELYEQLQRSSTGAFSTPQPTVVVNEAFTAPSPSQQNSRPQINQSPHSEPKHDVETSIKSEATIESEQRADESAEDFKARVQAKGDGEELHPNVRRGALPEFEGERNPKTGETGGPKNDPLRWGGGVDWSYNGRVTDF